MKYFRNREDLETLSSLSLDQKSPLFEPCSLSGSVDGINIWRQGVPTPEDCFSLPDSQACQSPVSFSLDEMAAQSSPTDQPTNSLSCTADMREVRESDLLNLFSDGLKTGPESIPSLDFASSAYVDSLSSSDGVSPTLHKSSVAPRPTASEVNAYPLYQSVDLQPFIDTTVDSPGTPMHHLPGCPSRRHYFPTEPHSQPQQAPSILGDYDQHRHASPCNHYCTVNAWQSTQHDQQGYDTQMQLMHHHHHHHMQQIHSPPNGHHHNIMTPNMFQSEPVHHQLLPEPIAKHEKSSNAAVLQHSGVGHVHASQTKRGKQAYSPAPSSLNPEGSSVTESEVAHGRHSHHYNALPHETDGKYHCAFEGLGDCDHAPTKLKCNFDKYIDSHLKPYRCSDSGCEDLRFSSTACQLRHEREAHGSHGHGQKPFLCLYEGCDRSRPEGGFPRSWNRSDHMKRVHGHKDSEVSEDNERQRDATSESPPLSANAKPAMAKKRQTSTVDHGDSKTKRQKAAPRAPNVTSIKQKPKSPVTEGSVIADLDNQGKLHDEWRRRRLLAQQFVHSLRGPDDTKNLAFLSAEVQAMREISQALTK